MFPLPQSAPCKEVIKQCSLYLSLYHGASLLTQLRDDVADTDVKTT